MDNEKIYFSEGNYKHWQANGYGKSYYQSGDLQYEGMWANGKYHGKGTLYDEAGNIIYSGEWRDGHKLNGALRENFDVDSDKLKKYLDELNSLIGLVNVKKELSFMTTAAQILKDFIDKLTAHKDENFGNARTMRNIFEQCIAFHANRIMNMPKIPDDLSTLAKPDIIRCIN